jgi:hypothetical protein
MMMEICELCKTFVPGYAGKTIAAGGYGEVFICNDCSGDEEQFKPTKLLKRQEGERLVDRP